MRYAEFRDRLENSLLDAGLMIHSRLPSTETIDLGDSVRHWKAWIIGITPPGTKPFDVSADISFEWNSVDAARAHTCEEDLLTALLGRRRESARTQPRWTRVDLSLRTSLPYGSTTSIPEPHLFGPWSTSVVDTVGAALTDVKERKGNIVAILGVQQGSRAGTPPGKDVQGYLRRVDEECVAACNLDPLRTATIQRQADRTLPR